MWGTHQFYISYNNTLKFNIFTTIKSLNSLLFNKKQINISVLTEEKKETLNLTLNAFPYLFSDKIMLLCEQIHGNKIAFLEQPLSNLPSLELNNGRKVYYHIFPSTDGIITTLSNAFIVIFTADCIPLFVYDEEEMVFGLVHAGRKGIELGIIDNLIEILAKNSQNIAKFKFVIGPHICPKCYIVDGKEYSLTDKIINQLLKLGVNKGNVTSSPFCTCHNSEYFYSYRKDKTECRNISVILPK